MDQQSPRFAGRASEQCVALLRREYQRVTLLESKIQLMLNAKEDDHQHLEKLIRRMVAAIQHEKGQKDEFPELHTEVIALSRSILKREWDRVKEPIQPPVAVTDA